MAQRAQLEVIRTLSQPAEPVLRALPSPPPDTWHRSHQRRLALVFILLYPTVLGLNPHTPEKCSPSGLLPGHFYFILRQSC